jgi:translocation and assembly module TamB
MADEDIAVAGAKPRRAWDGRWQRWLALALVLLLVVVGGALAWLDTAAGHRFLVARLERVAPPSGLRIRLDRIDGSIYRKAVLRGLTLSDPKGRFFDAPVAELDWWPFAWAYNRLDIDRLSVPQATLHRLPKLNPAERKGPILPGFDIRLMKLSVGQLNIAPAVSGRAQRATMAGYADIRGGRAIVDLQVGMLDGDDALDIALDSRPDDNRFDLDITANAPRGGVLAAMAGLKQDGALRVHGKGSWTKWDGKLEASLGSKSVADLVLAARSGAYAARGTVAGDAIGGNGLVARLAAPRLTLDASGTMVNRVIDGKLALRSASLALTADGAVDLRSNALDNLLVDLRLARPGALVRNMDARDFAAKFRLDGPFTGIGFEYLATAKQLTFGKTQLSDVRAEGKGRAGKGATLIPLKLRARSLSGQGELVETIARNFALDGVLQLKGQMLTSNPMDVRSDKLRGKLTVLADLGTGRYDAGLDGRIDALAIRGLGVVDIVSKLRATPNPDRSFGLSGQASARMRRLDNGFLSGLGGGLPTLRTALMLRPDGQLALDKLHLEAPLLTLDANGIRRRDGSFHFEGGGRHARYGPLKLTLDGRIERPTVDLLLDRPLDALGVVATRVHAEPTGTDYAFTANGGSMLGDFTGNGVVLLPPGGQAIVRVERLAVAGVTASGDIRPVTGGLDGSLTVAGPVRGSVGFAPVNGIQQLKLDLTAADAAFNGPTPISVTRGKLAATILLDPAGTTVDATTQGRGVTIGGISIGRLAGHAELVDGRGMIRGSAAGQRGRGFDLQGEAQVDPDRLRLSLRGTVDQRAIKLQRPATLSRSGDGWRLSPVTIAYGGGSLQLAGNFGGAGQSYQARLDKLPLTLLDLLSDGLGLGGVATGSVDVSQGIGVMPTGKAELRIRGLTRSGLSLSSRPVDMGLNAILTPDRLAARMLLVSDGRTLGRGQALIAPLPQGGGLMERLNGAPLQAQLRYAGAAETLWRMTGVEIVDIAGPVTIAADARGTLGNPQIAGTLSTDNGTISSAVTGMRLQRVKASGRFTGPQLVISSFDAKARNGGGVTGGGSFTFGGLKGVAMDLAFKADNAALLERDDIAATVTGPLTLKSDGVGGTIAGDMTLNRSSFTLGRATAAAQLPELKVTEVNRVGDEVESVRRNVPWNLAIKARARNRLTVTGLGLDSEWRADLDIGGTVTNPAIAGRAELVRGGYEFAGRRFDLREGHIQFDGRVPVNPTLDITAEADVSDLSATIHVGGTGLQPDITFTSVPALPQEELLSRILFGTSITNLSAPEALQLASAVGSLQGGGGLDPINAVRKAAGLDRLRIIAADPTQGQATSIAAGKYLTRKTYVELITDGQGYSATRIEYQVTRWLSLLGAISTLGRESANVRVSKDY